MQQCQSISEKITYKIELYKYIYIYTVMLLSCIHYFVMLKYKI